MQTTKNSSVRKKQRQVANTISRSMGLRDVPFVQSVAHTRPSKRVVSPEYAKRVAAVSRGLEYFTFLNPKTIKGLEYGWITAILHLAPANYSGYTVCKRFSQCMEPCLYHQGRGRMKNVQNARIRRTRNLIENFEDTMLQIQAELMRLQAKLKTHFPELQLACRPNGLSDLEWENMPVARFGGNTLFQEFPDIQFYDYTKIPYGQRKAWTNMPHNYHLTYSFDGREEDVDNCKLVLQHGYNVNVVHNKITYKASNHAETRIWDYPTYDNEEHDLRFTDARPLVLLGKEKGYSNIAI